MRYHIHKYLLFSLFTLLSGIPQLHAQSWQWGVTNSGGGADSWPIASDAAGNIYAAGVSYEGDLVFGSTTITYLGTGLEQGYVVKYNSAGAVLWAKGFMLNQSQPVSMATDPAGNLFILGIFQTQISIDTFNIYANPAYTYQYFLTKINSAGTVQWVRAGAEASNLYGNYTCSAGTYFILTWGAVATDAAGDAVITGNFNGNTSIGAFNLTNADGSGITDDVFVAKYDPSGNVLWATSFGGTSNDEGFGITANSLGNVYVTGDFISPTMSVGPSVLNDAAGVEIGYLAEYSPTGTALWGEAFGNTAGAYGAGLASDASGNIYLTGAFGDASVTFGSTTVNQTYPAAAPLPEVYLVQLNSSNTVTWNKTIGSPSFGMLGYCIALASCGQVWVSGSWAVVPFTDAFVTDSANIGGHMLYVPDSATDPVFIAGYNLSGGVVGYGALQSGADDQNGIACDPSGNIYICADYWNQDFTVFNVGPNQMFGDPTYNPSEFFYLAKYTNVIAGADTVHLSNDTVLCSNMDSIVLSPPLGYTAPYLWSNGDTTSTLTLYTTGTVWVRALGGCSSSFLDDTFHVQFTPPDSTYISTDTTLCAGAVNTLAGPAGYTTYNWNTGATTYSLTVTSSGNYWVIASVGCAAQFDTFHVDFHVLPVVNLGNDTGFCLTDTLILRSTQPAGYTFLWNNGSTADTMGVDSSGAYWLAVTDSGCVTTDTIHIIVAPPPVFTLGPDTTTCILYVLQPSPLDSGITYTWSTGSTTDTIHVGTTGTYWLTEFNGGCSASDTVNVTIVNDTFVLYNRDTSICAGNVVQVLSYFDTGMYYQWIPTAGIRYSTTPAPLITPDTSAMYVVTAQYPGCKPFVDSFYIDVEPNPSLFVGDDRFVCQFDTLHLNALVSPAWYTQYSYTWSPAAVLNNTNTANVIFFSPTTTTVYLTVSTPAGCTAVDSTLVTVYPGNFASLNMDTTICPADSVQLIAGGGGTYHWYPSLYLSDSLSADPWAHPLTTQFYTLIVTSPFGCLDTVTANIAVYPNAILNVPDSVVLYPGQTYQFNPATNCVNFYWFPPAGLSSNIVSNPLASPQTTTKYVIKASNEFGCRIVDSTTIIIDPQTLLAMPNVFTPGNGPNNVLYILKLGEASLNYYRIFNRWGNLVFETNSIDAGWDGTFHGVAQPEDVYVYEIQAVTNTGTVFTKKGNVTLLR